jgi:hypothetical protein
MLKTLSILGYIGMIGGVLGLLATQQLFSSSPFVIAVQALALLLVIWARITFGRRSFHVVANPTDGGLVTGGPYRYIRHPIYAAICLSTSAGVAAHLSWSAGLLQWSGFVYCADTYLLRGVPGGGALSRVFSIRSYDLAHDPVCLLALHFPMGRLTLRLSQQPTPLLLEVWPIHRSSLESRCSGCHGCGSA